MLRGHARTGRATFEHDESQDQDESAASRGDLAERGARGHGRDSRAGETGSLDRRRLTDMRFSCRATAAARQRESANYEAKSTTSRNTELWPCQLQALVMPRRAPLSERSSSN